MTVGHSPCCGKNPKDQRRDPTVDHRRTSHLRAMREGMGNRCRPNRRRHRCRDVDGLPLPSRPVECICLRSCITTHCPALPTAVRPGPKALVTFLEPLGRRLIIDQSCRPIMHRASADMVAATVLAVLAVLASHVAETKRTPPCPSDSSSSSSSSSSCSADSVAASAAMDTDMVTAGSASSASRDYSNRPASHGTDLEGRQNSFCLEVWRSAALSRAEPRSTTSCELPGHRRCNRQIPNAETCS